MTIKSKPLRLNEIETRRPLSNDCVCVSLGGTNLYAQDGKALLAALDGLQGTIEKVLAQNFCLIRQVLRSVVVRELGQEVPDRIYGAILGRALRFGTVAALPCLTVNNKVLRTYLLASRFPELQHKLQVSTDLLRSQSAVSVLAVQSRCFPEREWGSSYMAQQLMGHLALRGLAVFVDKDLFSWPRIVQDAVRTNH
jgi:hypothetical protein